GGEVEQPRTDDRPASPDLRDCGNVDVELVELGMLQGRGLGVLLALSAADVRVLEDGEPFGVRGHDPVLDAVVDHLHEVTGAIAAAVQVPLFRTCRLTGASWRALSRLDSRCECGEHGVESFDGFVVAADHLAVAALESEHAAARADVD